MRRRIYDLTEEDFDPPVMRFVLACWREKQARWFPLMITRVAADRLRLLDWGEFFAGSQPWSQTVILDVHGRLGSVERTLAALPRPSPLVLKAPDVRPTAAPAVFAPEVRRRVRKDAGKPKGQGSLL